MLTNSSISHQKRPRLCPFNRLPCVYPCFNLVQARMQASKSDDEVAKILDVSRSTWWRYRRGHQKPPRSVCAILHVLAGHFPWDGWTRCYLNQHEQRLYVDDNQFGLNQHDLKVYWWQMQELQFYRRKKKSDERSRDDTLIYQAEAREARPPLGLVFNGITPTNSTPEKADSSQCRVISIAERRGKS